MVDLEVFNNLERMATSSWAVWDERNENTSDFFLSKRKSFHGRVIFVGLNRSNIANDLSKVSPLSNFHTKGHVGDNRLKRFVQDNNLSNLIGGFMTDISEQIETNSNRVDVEEQAAVKNFSEKVRLIDDSQTRRIICFGNKVFDTFTNALGISKSRIKENRDNKIKEVEVKGNYETWHFYRVWHYSNYGDFIHKSERELPVQLKYINDEIENQTASKERSNTVAE